MAVYFFIVAQQTEREPGWGALIYLIIFFLIWIISAIVNVLNKRHQKRRAEMEEEEEWEPVKVEDRMRREAPVAPPRMPERRLDRPPVVAERRPARMEPAPPPLPRGEMPRAQRQIRQAPAPRREFPTGAPARQPDRRFPAAQRRVPVTEMPPAGSEVFRRTEIGAGSERQQAALGRATPVGAPAVARMLQPTTLQQNFILTEILQPPKGLRPPE